MEAVHLQVGRARPFGEDHHRVSVVHLAAELLGQPFVAALRRVEAGEADDAPEEGRAPHPVVGHHDQPRREAQQQQDVDERLVVGHHDGRAFEALAAGVDASGARGEDGGQEEAAEEVERPVEPGLAPAAPQRQHEEQCGVELQQQTPRHEVEEGVERVGERPERVGEPSARGLPRDEHPEEDGLHRVGDQHDGRHPHNRDEGERVERRVAGEEQCADAGHGGEGREEDGGLVGREQAAPVAVLAQQSVHDENAEVVAQTEDEGREDDVDDVELDVQQGHQPEDEHPAHRHGEAGQQRQLDAPVGEQQRAEDQRRGDEEDGVEVVVDHPGHAAGEVGAVEDAHLGYAFERGVDALLPGCIDDDAAHEEGAVGALVEPLAQQRMARGLRAGGVEGGVVPLEEPREGGEGLGPETVAAGFSGLQKASHAAMRRRCTSIGTTKSAAEAGSRSSPARANESSMRCVRP